MTCFFANDKELYTKVRNEVDGAVAKYRKSDEQTASEVLQSLSYDAWATEFPFVELCVRESIRMVLPGSMMRKNTSGEDIEISGTNKVIPKDTYAVCISLLDKADLRDEENADSVFRSTPSPMLTLTRPFIPNLKSLIPHATSPTVQRTRKSHTRIWAGAQGCILVVSRLGKPFHPEQETQVANSIDDSGNEIRKARNGHGDCHVHGSLRL